MIARTTITAIDEVNRERCHIGSEQNKLQFIMSNLTSQTRNIEADEAVAVIPPLSNRQQLRHYDKHPHKQRHLIGCSIN
ncbi:MAG: hypothetical protein VCF25_26525 [Candidatus Poribacteria bacterium]